MTALRSTGYLAKRVRQTPALFRNFPAVFADLALGRTRLARSEMTLRLRNGLTITTPKMGAPTVTPDAVAQPRH